MNLFDEICEKYQLKKLLIWFNKGKDVKNIYN